MDPHGDCSGLKTGYVILKAAQLRVSYLEKTKKSNSRPGAMLGEHHAKQHTHGANADVETDCILGAELRPEAKRQDLGR